MLVLKKAFITPDFDEKLSTVHTRSGFYANALQSKVIRDKQQQDILEWICPKGGTSIPPKRRDEVVNTHQPFVNSEEYLNWVGNGSPTLICTGHRTFFFETSLILMKLAWENHTLCLSLFLQPFLTSISSMIFNRLRENPKLGISYFFFNHSNREETAENVIRVLLRQSVAQLPRIPGDVSAEYSRFINDPHRVMPSRKTLATLLISSLKEFSSSPRFILLDAYDEFRNTSDEERQRTELCSLLSAICRSGLARILITTRPQCRQELKDALIGSQIAVVKGDSDDVEKYLDDQIMPLKRLNDELKANIKKTILDANRKEGW